MYFKDATYSTRDRHCEFAPPVHGGIDVHALAVMAIAIIAWYVLDHRHSTWVLVTYSITRVTLQRVHAATASQLHHSVHTQMLYTGVVNSSKNCVLCADVIITGIHH
jgi:hypothetical protein